MKKNTVVLVVMAGLVLVIVVIGGFYLFRQPAGEVACTAEAKLCPDGSFVGRGGPRCEFAKCPDIYSDLIRVTLPAPNAVVSSPLTVRGEARGSWYFEASFPVQLLDANGKILSAVPAQSQGDWMTNEFVPFEAILSFIPPTTPTGTLILHNDNPSGLSANDKEIRVPVTFFTTSTRAIQLYYYNAAKDQGPGGVQCSSGGLDAVLRAIPITKTPIQDAVRLLLKGELTSEEKLRGITTEYPLSGFELIDAALTGGVLTLRFDDPQGKTVGGSCRVSLLRLQIEATVKQFSEVKSVRFLPTELFQP